MRNIALVTGASSGMGKEFVREISKKYKGLDEIWVVARRRERLRELRKEIIGTRVRILPLDLMEQILFPFRRILRLPMRYFSYDHPFSWHLLFL